MEPIRCIDLAPGDVLLRISDGAIVDRATALGQPLMGQLKPAVVDGGVMADRTLRVEGRGGSLRAHDLTVEGKPFAFLAFRARKETLAADTGRCARMVLDAVARDQEGSDDPWGMLGSPSRGPGGASAAEMDHLLERVLEGRGHRFFCSHVVIHLYRFVAERHGIPGSHLFPQSDARISPSVLASSLDGNGEFRAVGYLMAHER